MIDTSYIARIVPAKAIGDGPHKAQGTEIFVGDAKLGYVTGLTLRCEVGDLWRATIECMVEPPTDLLAAAVFEVAPPDRWYHRVLRWITGEPRNVTNLASTEFEWER